MRQKRVLLLLLAALLLFFTMAMAGGSGIDLSWHHLPGGGGHIVAGNYALDYSVGIPLAGQARSDGLTLCAGFWCTQGPPQLDRHLYLPAIARQAP